MDILECGTPSKVVEQLEWLVLRHKPSTDAMSSSWSENCTQKESVFIRLKKSQRLTCHMTKITEARIMLRGVHVAKSDV